MITPLPGDIVVSPIPGGYVVGRVRTPPEQGGLAWEYIRVEEDAAAAAKFAEQLADRANVAAWLFEGTVAFRELRRKGLGGDAGTRRA